MRAQPVSHHACDFGEPASLPKATNQWAHAKNARKQGPAGDTGGWATSSTPTVVRLQVVEHRRPGFLVGTRCHIVFRIAASPTPNGKAIIMDDDQQVGADVALVSESLVEEVSIDGMCGVY
jgi:mycofactocin precursor